MRHRPQLLAAVLSQTALVILAAAAISGCGAAGSQPAGSGSPTDATAVSSRSTTTASKPLPPPTRTSCRSVVYIGDSTSDGEELAAYVPNRKLRAPAQLHKVGVKVVHMQVSGARSIVETFEGFPNGATVAQQQVDRGYQGCWLIALGTNDAANVAVGSVVGLKQRIQRMMSIIGDQPVMWINAITIDGAPEYYEESGMRRWDKDLVAACRRYPNLRVFDWASEAKPKWFISDGVHYTTAGYEHRTRLIAQALVKAFPAGRPPSATCSVS
jgi:lysophospholipase L1-like esterase